MSVESIREARKFSVTLEGSNSEIQIDCLDGERILLAGLRQGLCLPYECGTGTCGECRAEALNREHVNTMWTQAPGSARHHPSEILMCQTTVTESTTIRTPRETICGLNDWTPVPAYQSATIESIEMVDPGTAVLRLRLSQPIDYLGGQFLLAGVPGIDGYRAYSIANYPGTDGILKLIIRRKSGGTLTEWLFAESRVGIAIEIFGPLGKACLDPDQDGDIAVVVGGSGISSGLGIIEHALKERHFRENDGYLYFGVRTPDDALFADLIERHVRASDYKLKATIAFSEFDPPDSLIDRYDHIELASGYVHEVAASSLKKMACQPTTCLAGPPPMVDGAIRSLITECRIPPSRIRFDKFS